MATITDMGVAHGYCIVYKSNVAIRIEYVSIPLPTDRNGYRTFWKNSNQCYYLQEGKCNLRNECEVFKKAEKEYVKYVGRV